MFKKLLIVAVIVIALTTYAFAALFTSPTTQVFSGATDISIPVTLDKQGDSIASFNSTLQFDTAKLAFKGVSTALGNKSIDYNQVAAGQIKFVVYGLNADGLVDGVVFSAVFDVVQGAGGQSTVTFIDTVAADPVAGLVSSITIDPIVFDITLKGDLDGDGFVNTQDVLIMIQQLLTGATLPLDDLDINEDGVFNVQDLQALINIAIG